MRTVASDMMHNEVRRQRAAVDVAWQVHEMTVDVERVLTDLSLAAAGTQTTTFNTDTAHTLNLSLSLSLCLHQISTMEKATAETCEQGTQFI